jgi:hypothetical protein
MGEKEHEDPAITKKIHYEMLSTLLGRYDLIHIPLESNQMLIWLYSYIKILKLSSTSFEAKKQHEVQFSTAIGMAFLGSLQD